MEQSDFTQKSESDKIELLHNTVTHNPIFEHKEGQPGLLCSNKKLCGCPSLRYEYVEAPEKLERVFNMLFEEALIISLREDTK